MLRLQGLTARLRGKASAPEDEEDEARQPSCDCLRNAHAHSAHAGLQDDDFEGVPNALLGVNMTAVAVPGRVLTAPRGMEQLPLPTERVPVILNFGIIDILQEYNISKQTEHLWKARHARSCVRATADASAPQSYVQQQDNISSVDPHAYAARFLSFMEALFR